MLHVQIEGIANYRELCLRARTPDTADFSFRWGPDYVLDSRTQMLALLAVNIGLGEIATRNVDEWCYRLAVWQKATGAPLMSGDGQEVYLTRLDVEAHIGLRVNVTPVTRAKFRRFVLDMLERDGTYEMEQSELVFASAERKTA